MTRCQMNEDERAEALAEEQGRVRRLRMVVDLTTAVLMQGRLTPEEALEVVASARREALELFPDKEATYDLILAPRFERLMKEFVQPARVLAFRPPG
jgi:hypothetical protein